MHPRNVAFLIIGLCIWTVNTADTCLKEYTASASEQHFTVKTGIVGCQALVKPTDGKKAMVYLKVSGTGSATECVQLASGDTKTSICATPNKNTFNSTDQIEVGTDLGASSTTVTMTTTTTTTTTTKTTTTTAAKPSGPDPSPPGSSEAAGVLKARKKRSTPRNTDITVYYMLDGAALFTPSLGLLLFTILNLLSVNCLRGIA
ncbi:unnamed protein product [Echinostoma caproni]|uniref:Mucin-1-like n=1 Tax=Echinostoma caproni TaxID=27848 RepID=A0A183B1A7_9TREM|nr:unnamed protein product [Echinostoma caproni]